MVCGTKWVFGDVQHPHNERKSTEATVQSHTTSRLRANDVSEEQSRFYASLSTQLSVTSPPPPSSSFVDSTMSLDGISLALEIASRIEAQTDKSKKNKGKLRHLSLQALAVADDIREHYALLEKQNVVLPKSMVDTISQLELILGKILRVVEKEQSRTRFKSWLRASSQADKCMLLSEELAACATRFGMVANLHILGQTRVISVRQDQIAARDGELLRTLVTKSTSLPAVKQYQVVENVVGGASMVFCSGLDSSQREGHSHVDDFLIEERQGFEGFLGCLEQTLTTRCEVLSPLQETFTFFLQHLESRHQGLAICYAATETFVVEYADELKVCACVAVLKEDYDLRPNYDDRVGNFARCRKDFLFEFTLLTVTDTHTSPSDWIKVQGLANHFQRERIAYALWDLGRLPPASHIPDSDSFRWIRQRISTIPTVSGERVVVDVESGNDNYPFRRFHQLNARIAHPSNARCRLDLIQHLDNEIRLVCEETNEEWFISVIHHQTLP
ncbi:unnamed protein product [Cyclocybe aegerita]|uniref:Uncharacterized protein n=1 Tax=Cyclocybe aegerita TaxID=1973307 RepID=A0A8S0XGY5_CYCAE|nr:unnamed protein product [Cyclocybe aegerita]